MKDLYIVFFLYCVTFSKTGLILGTILENAAQDMCVSFKYPGFCYVWCLDLHGSCLFVC